MNSLKKLLACLMFGLIVTSYSCKDDDEPSGCDWAAEVQDELTALTTAGNAWASDPTNTAKCQAYKDAAQAYLDELEDHVDCATISGDQAELQAQIDQAQIDVNNIQC